MDSHNEEEAEEYVPATTPKGRYIEPFLQLESWVGQFWQCGGEGQAGMEAFLPWLLVQIPQGSKAIPALDMFLGDITVEQEASVTILDLHEWLRERMYEGLRSVGVGGRA
jgi:hypothetical protein